MSPATIEIVIPAFNAMAELPQCVDSVQKVCGPLLGETVQLHIQDGGSSDGTLAYLETVAGPGIGFLSEPDTGIYNAMNRAVARSRSDWVLFLGADDRLLPGFRLALDHLHDKGTVYYGDAIFTSSGKRYDGRFSALKLVYRNICHQAMFFPTAMLQQSPFDERYIAHADWAKNIELSGRVRFEYLDEAIAQFRDRTGTSATVDDSVFTAEKPALFRQYHGPWLMWLCKTAPLPTFIYQLMIGRKR